MDASGPAGKADGTGNIPEQIASLLPAETHIADEIGQSSASVQIFSDRVLKTEPEGAEAENEVCMLLWLREKLAQMPGCGVTVPGVLAHAVRDGRSFLLMEKCPGRMACDEQNMSHPQELIRLLAEALEILWRADISDCPAQQTLDHRLSLAARNVTQGMVGAEPLGGYFGGKRLSDPRALLAWLEEHRPTGEAPVLSHGDFSLPNIFLSDHAVSGFIDLGRMGTGDRWFDIAVCWRSLWENYKGKYSTRTYPEYRDNALFRALDLTPDRERIRYYLLLEELL